MPDQPALSASKPASSKHAVVDGTTADGAIADETAETRTRILEAAHRVFMRRGTSGARTREIAEEAGVNKALLHYYFSSKDRLAQEVFMRAVRSVFPVVFETLQSDLPLQSKLQRVVDIELDLMTANPYLPGYIIAEFQYRHERLKEMLEDILPVEKARERALSVLQKQLDHEADAGRIRPTRAIDLVVSLVSQIIFPFAAAPVLEAAFGLDLEQRIELVERNRDRLADALLAGLRPR